MSVVMLDSPSSCSARSVSIARLSESLSMSPTARLNRLPRQEYMLSADDEVAGGAGGTGAAAASTDDDDDELVMSVHEPFKSPLAFIDPRVFFEHQSPARGRYRVLGTLSLVAISYFSTCGGPVGSEPIISAGGPLIGVSGILLYALLCQIPFVWIVTELSAAFPENGGFTVWVLNAFGPFWGFQVGYWAWITSVVSNAVFPNLVFSVLVDAYDLRASTPAIAFMAKAGIAVLPALPAFVGVRCVASSAILVLGVVLAVACVFAVWGFAAGAGAVERLGDVRRDSSGQVNVDWSHLVNVIFWNFDGIYLTSVVGGEVARPTQTFPRVFVLTLLLTVLTYVLPWTSAVVADRLPWLQFDEDAYPEIARAIGGSPLQQIVSISSILSSLAMYTCALLCQTFQVCGMAEMNLLPGILRRRSSRFDVPHFATLLSLVASIILLELDFHVVLSLGNAFGAAIQVLIILSMLQLRAAYPYIPRPVRVPGNRLILAALLVCPSTLFVFILVTTLLEPISALVLVALLLPGRLDADGASAGCEVQQNEFGGVLVTPEQIKAAFEFLDVDKKNRVTADNLRARLSIFYDQLGTRDLKLLLNDQTELTEDYLNTLLLTNEVKQFDPVAEAFKAYDPEETGVISRDMLRYVFERLGFGALTDEDVDILVACADHDGDGQINLDDFRHLLI
ncbi:hypothetical protein ATCC90586_007512 [Pythium insidiosum]|nr:hypothetical protein ATCC90586_007512 [Pythium insidiosum]